MRIAFSLCIGLLVSLLSAVGQGDTVDPVSITEPEQTLNIEHCLSDTFSFTVRFTNTYTGTTTGGTTFSSSPYEIWLSRGSGCSFGSDEPDINEQVTCLDNPDSCCERLEANLTVTADADTGYTDVSFSNYELSDYVACDSREQGTFAIEVYYQPKDGFGLDVEDWSMSDEAVQFDLLRPDPPTVESTEPGETSVVVHWIRLADETTRYRAYASIEDFDTTRSIDDQSDDLVDLQSSKTTDEDESDATIKSLRAQTSYYVTVVSIDELDNESDPAESMEVSTVEVQDFYELYRASGGADPGGYCSVATEGRTRLALASALLLLLVSAGLIALRRRRAARGAAGKGAALGLALVLGVLAASEARAESPRTLTLGLSMGSYLPAIDDEFHSTGDGPYEAFYGDDGVFITRIDVGWHLFQDFGTLSLGGGAGYGSKSARGFVDGSTTRAVEESKIALLPFNLSLAYSFDVLAEQFDFPLIPFGSLGLDYVIWWIYDGSDEIAASDEPDGSGEGGTWGYHGSIGVKLLLDVLAPDMAQSFDLDMGVNNSYLYLEYLMSSVDGFGDKDSINLSTEALYFGIAFDF